MFLVAGLRGRFGCSCDHARGGQGGFGGPARDAGPDSAPLGQVSFAGRAGQEHRGKAVQGLAGQPGHSPPSPPGAWRVACGFWSLVMVMVVTSGVKVIVRLPGRIGIRGVRAAMVSKDLAALGQGSSK
jgi:hypothetical protein